MSAIKILQKLGLEQFKKLYDQVRTEGVHVISSEDLNEPITSPKILGKVQSVFNLGKKLDVRVNETCPTGKAQFRFEQLGGVFYLVRKTP